MLFVSNWWTIDAKMILGVMEMPLQFIFITSVFITSLSFLAAGYYKAWKNERKVICLTDCKLKCFFSHI